MVVEPPMRMWRPDRLLPCREQPSTRHWQELKLRAFSFHSPFVTLLTSSSGKLATDRVLPLNTAVGGQCSRLAIRKPMKGNKRNGLSECRAQQMTSISGVATLPVEQNESGRFSRKNEETGCRNGAGMAQLASDYVVVNGIHLPTSVAPTRAEAIVDQSWKC